MEDEKSKIIVDPSWTVLRRRDLLGMGIVAATGVVATAIPILRFANPAAGWVTTDKIEIPEDDVRLWEAVRVVLRGQPCFVVRTPDRIHACSGVCSHLGCIVRWNRSRHVYFCPCHGARFAADGRVLGGPAPAPLSPFKVEVSQGKIVVELA
jgi:cytochrome b6-f complex iron-sulfur subunit